MFISDLTSMILENQVQEFKIQWYFIPGYQDVYCVGSDGSVWSRYVKVSFTEWVVGGDDDWFKLALRLDDYGYPSVVLNLNGRKRSFKAHQLIADAFLGPCPVGLYCCHEDGNPGNNHVCNLRYDTPKGNQDDRLKHGTDARGENNANAFLTQDRADLIREEYATGQYTQVQLGKRHGVSQGSISHIVTNRVWVQ